MAELVGARGYVLATDIDTRWTQGDGLSQLEFRQHDVVTDPLAQGEFDVAHARLVLSWLPDRDTVISRLVAALRPGGWLVVEDFDSMLHQCLDPLNDDERVFGKVTDAFRQALHRRGADTTWARTLPTASPRPGWSMSARPGTSPSSTAVLPRLSCGSPTSTRSETGSSTLA
jgi:SAM-dependent methyltransferase